MTPVNHRARSQCRHLILAPKPFREVVGPGRIHAGPLDKNKIDPAYKKDSGETETKDHPELHHAVYAEMGDEDDSRLDEGQDCGVCQVDAVTHTANDADRRKGEES